MQFSVVALFAASALAFNSTSTQTEVSTSVETITSCDETVTDCPVAPKHNDTSVPTYSGAAVGSHGSYYAAGAAALAAGALLM